MNDKYLIIDEFHQIPLSDEEKGAIKKDWQQREVMRFITTQTQSLSDFGVTNDTSKKGADQ